MKSVWLIAWLSMLCANMAVGQTSTETVDQASLPSKSNIEEAEIVTYPARFFGQYQPLTALDMVKQVPGFQIDDGDELRGFGSAAGNVLIDFRRPSAKQDLVSEILARIPAENVERIELKTTGL